MKGIELPINVLIIVAIAIIVLIALVAMFYPSFFSGSSTFSLEMAKSQACHVLVEGKKCNSTFSPADISISGFDANKDGKINPGSGVSATCPSVTGMSISPGGGGDDDGGASASNDNFLMLCLCYYQITSESDCRKLCGC